MSKNTMRGLSRKDYEVYEEQSSFEAINAGSLQRIADAMDVMAKDRVQLEKDLAWYKERYGRKVNEIDVLNRSVASYKGKYRSLKNKYDELVKRAGK